MPDVSNGASHALPDPHETGEIADNASEQTPPVPTDNIQGVATSVSGDMHDVLRAPSPLAALHAEWLTHSWRYAEEPTQEVLRFVPLFQGTPQERQDFLGTLGSILTMAMYEVDWRREPDAFEDEVTARQQLRERDDVDLALQALGACWPLARSDEDRDAIRAVLARHLPVDAAMGGEWLRHWYYSYRTDPSFAFSHHFMRLQELEAARPGASRALYERYGIRSFGRYDVDVLTRQYDERENRSLPYGIVLTGMEDHNGAHFRRVNDLAPQVRALRGADTHLLRCIEANSPRDLARRIICLDRTYRERGGHPIGFAVVLAHGRDGQVCMHYGRGGSLTPQSLVNADLGPRLAPGAEVVIHACEGGKEGGFAHALSHQQLSVQASPDILRMLSYDVEADAQHRVRFRKKLAVQEDMTDATWTQYRDGERVA